MASAVSCSQVQLQWTDKSNNETGFEIWRKINGGSYQKTAAVSANVTQYSDQGVVALTTYTYQVRAVNAAGPSRQWSNEAAATTGPPAVPAGLQVTAASDTQLTVTWVDSSACETSTEVWRKTATADWALVGSTPANATSYADQGLTAGTSYTYRVRAACASGASAWTAEVTGTTLPPPPPLPDPVGSDPPRDDTTLPPSTAADQVKAAERALEQGYKDGLLDVILARYADAFQHEDGETKLDLGDFLEWYLQSYRVIAWQVLDEQYTANSLGDHVTQSITSRVTERDSETGEDTTYDSICVVEWQKVGSDWKIVSARDGAIPGP